jgi:GT2 family glycosyltransferase
MVELSVIIASHNTCRLLADCLTSIASADPPANGYEVIVVDNASADGSADMVRREFPDVKLISNSKNLGFSAANNQGAAVAAGEYLLFLNSDTYVGRDALAAPLAYLRPNPQVGALTVRLVYANGQRDPDNHRGFPTPWTSFCHFSGLDRLGKGWPLFDNYYQSYRDFCAIHEIDVAAGSYLLMPADLFHDLGGWDEEYFFYGEDIDLCYRIHEAGRTIVYYPPVEVRHYKGASSGIRKESAQFTRPPRATRMRVAHESSRAMGIFYRKFYGDKYPALITALVLAAIRAMGWLRVLRHRLT